MCLNSGMDLYRYFQPHHNSRLRKAPLRLQEWAELEQAAAELKKALKRAQIRTNDTLKEQSPYDQESLSDILLAIDYIVNNLANLTSLHPGDEPADLSNLLKERKNSPGWENWTRMLEQKLELDQS